MAALCKTKGIHSKRNLSGFNYFELETSDVAPMIDWYNVQLYCGWGDPAEQGVYEGMVATGWRPERLVLGVVTSPRNGGGYVEPSRLFPAMELLAKKYGDRFGGVMGWEYFNSGMYGMQSTNDGPWTWVRSIAKAIGRVQD
jgi:hypothetical protein